MIKHNRLAFLTFAILVAISNLVFKSIAVAQVEPPDRQRIFFEDNRAKKEEKKRRKDLSEKQKRIRGLQKKGLPFNIDAPSINYDATGKIMHAEGGLIVAYGTTILEAQKGDFNVETREADVQGDVRITDLTGDLIADSAKLNMETGEGTLKNSYVYSVEGGYRVWAKETQKLDADQYLFKDATITTCLCSEDDSRRPWAINGKEVKITQNGYGQVFNGNLSVHDVPVMYVPYLLFPAKTSRQSGLLPASFGYSDRNGVELQLPVFLVIDRSADATLTGIYQSETRTGLETEYRQVLSHSSSILSGITYLDESARGHDLKGTNIAGLADPEIKTERFAGYLKGNGNVEIEDQKFQLLSNLKYVNDDLILRELDQPRIGPYNTRFVTSNALVRTNVLGDYSLELGGTYNQAMVDHDQQIFQQLPNAGLLGIEVFHPFGQNPYGAKAVLQNSLYSTYFYRELGYQGVRNEAYEKLKVPFHVQNYLEAEVSTDLRGDLYDLSDDRTFNLASNGNFQETGKIDSSSDRLLPGFGSKVGTTVEKVFTVDDDSWIKQITELGTRGRTEKLARLMHTFEPAVLYRFVPKSDQSGNPQFDANDRLERRNVITYQLTQRLFARYENRDENAYGIEEATPELKDVGEIQETGPLDERFNFGLDDPAASTFKGFQKRSKAELANFTLGQSYDVVQEITDRRTATGDTQSPFSDVTAGLNLMPNEYVHLRGATNYNFDTSNFDSYSIEDQLFDKRGDEIRTRLSFVKDNIRQLETGLELLITDRLKVGYYSRYDDLKGEFIESRAGIRRISSCNCWSIDFEYDKRLNPNKESYLATITLKGLGEISSKLLTNDLNDNTTYNN